MIASPVQTKLLVDAFALRGGLDEITPTLLLKPGPVRAAYNYEQAVMGGYSRIGGYERFDGRARPSSATYTAIQVTAFVTTPSTGQTLTGQTSGATGQIIALGSNYLVLTLVTGSFSSAEQVNVGGTVIGTTTPLTVTISSLLNAQYLSLAADAYRVLIGIVPGSGPIRGVVAANFGGVHQVFAFRDNVGATATLLYQASTSGWTLVPFYNEVSFSLVGATLPTEGKTLTQGAVTSTIKRVVMETANTGRLIITNPSGGNFAAGNATTPDPATVTLTGAQTAITFLTGGKFSFDYGNLSGQPTTARLYGADGVNRCFEFDGSILVPINTYVTPDQPKYIKVHRLALVVSIKGSLLISGPGLPYQFGAIQGGAELAMHDTVTGLYVLPGMQANPTLGVDTTNETWILYGSAAGGSNPWLLVPFNEGVGGKDYSQQVLVDGYKMDDRGITNLQSAKEYGNFVTGTLSFGLQNFINSKRGLIACSSVHRTKSQYRVFFTDGTGLYMTIINAPTIYPQIAVGKNVGAMPINVPNPLNVVWNTQTVTGEEVTYAGSASGGYVYMLDLGSSFDGAALNASLTLSYVFMKSPRQLKRFRRASIELSGSFYAQVSIGYTLGYGQAKYSQPNPQTYTSNLSSTPFWDAVSWDAFTWDGQTLSPTEIELGGTAENIQYTFYSGTNFIQPYTITTVITHYIPRRLIR